MTIIFPFYNEKQNIEFLLQEIKNSPRNENYNVDLVFVDDGSNDDYMSAFDLYKLDNDIKLIKLSKNYGSHSAIKAGILNSNAELTVILPVDLQVNFEDVEIMIKKSDEYDIVWAVRKTSGVGKITGILSKIYSNLVKKFVNNNFPKSGIETVLFNSKVKDCIRKTTNSNDSVILEIMALGFKQGYVEIEKKNRKHGKSKWTISKKIKLFVDTFVTFSYAPIRAVTFIGLVFSIVAFLWTLYIITRSIFVGDLAPGWPALISVLLFGFGLTNISLGIIAEYLWRTLDASRKRPSFIVDEIITIKEENV